MFTVADIRDIAIQIEQNGEKSYQRASEAVVDSKLAIIFRWMAEEERRHAKYFASLAVDGPLSPEQQEIEAMGRSLLQDMVRDKTFSLEQNKLNAAEKIVDLLEQSLAFERDTVLFYEFLHDIVDEPAIKRQVQVIIEEEKRHVAMLTRLAANERVDDLMDTAGEKCHT